MNSCLSNVLSRINQAEKAHGRLIGSVQLLAASKNRSISAIQTLYAQGQRLFGENHLQEAMAKMTSLPADIIWHFIGPIQSNKTRKIAENFAWVQSVASLNIAKRLNDQRPSHLPPLNICIEINVDAEITKAGVSVEAAIELAQACLSLPRLTLRGLMAIPAPCATFTQQRKSFHTLHEIFHTLNQQGILLDTLSMGMTDDMEAAIAEGSTMVRIGRALFDG